MLNDVVWAKVGAYVAPASICKQTATLCSTQLNSVIHVLLNSVVHVLLNGIP
jgi:hypothetical protein